MQQTAQLTWWQSAVIYQIYPRSFQDSNGDGIGDLPGIQQRLPYLAWLGVDAIWLSPVFVSPMEDFGYDVADYQDIAPIFGTLADADNLIAAAHEHGLKILFDYVPNHSSRAHPWFQESRLSRDNSRHDWYIWRDPAPNGGPPNNWNSMAQMGTMGSAWVWDEPREQYYLASFSPAQPDINWRNPAARQAMLNVLRFWLDRGIDGFRIDMIDFLGKDDQFRDEPPPTFGTDNYVVAAVHHIDRAATRETIRAIKRVINSYPDRVAIGEVGYYLSPQQIRDFYGDPELLDLATNFRFTIAPFEATAVREFVDLYDQTLGELSWPNHNFGNHDRPRLMRFGQARARLAAMLLLTLRGTPILYYGDEIGIPDFDIPPERRQDPFGIAETGTSRDVGRTPMQWSADPFAGFSTVEPWLPVSPDYTTVNVALQRNDPESLLSFYQRLLTLRRSMPALTAGDYKSLDGFPVECVGYTRTTPEQVVLVVLNFTATAQICNLSDIFGQAYPWHLRLSTMSNRAAQISEQFELAAYEAVVLERSVISDKTMRPGR